MMIFVSGTKRSGTSMWMQVLRAAGRPVLGEAFPPTFAGALRAANQGGFYESILRNGIYFATNPHPVSGRYFLPEHVAGHAVKVFVPGVIRSERAYIGRLIANVRPWQEYEASIARLYALEDAAMRARGQPVPEDRYMMPPAYEWWLENFSLVRDITLRRYPARLMSYAQVLADPAGSVAAVLRFIADAPVAAGQVDDLAAALAAVKPDHRTQDRPASATVLPPEDAQAFDDLHAAVVDGSLFTRPALLRQLSAHNLRLLPELTALQSRALESELRQARSQQPQPAAIAGLPEKLAGFE
ncbi:hypothetical protein [Nannocystis sp.]|uniref:hypothetical protein n=1 Tax=Nannocystis sp. TaxID=1962667 RepID=UPI0025E86187|nr:hypothetical protein [Nannocystis sp.]MBK7830397.1 hypothetical protein [Nannocystis sp.]